MNIKPLRDRVLIKVDKALEKTEGGIFLPDTVSKDKPQKGTIVAVGGGKKLENGNVVPLEVKEGDKVYFTKYAGTEIKVEEEEYLLMREDDILAVQ